MRRVIEDNKYELDDFANYAAPALIQMSGMARRAKREFAGYLMEMAAAELLQPQKREQASMERSNGELDAD